MAVRELAKFCSILPDVCASAERVCSANRQAQIARKRPAFRMGHIARLTLAAMSSGWGEEKLCQMHELVRDVTLCILFAWVLGLLAHFSRQPLILAYLIAGFFIGPFGMGWVKSQEAISIISELGLIFMLFMIGLEIDLKKIVRAGRVILFAALGQLVGGCILGILFFIGMGLSMGGGGFDALYLCIACALSSTVIIVKVLYEKRELDTLPGRITWGLLVLQDIFAILFLAVQPSLDNLLLSVILLSVGRVGVLVATATRPTES